MPELQSSSIIPSNRPTVRTRVVTEGGAWLFSLAVIAFVATLVAAGGVFIYRSSLENAREDWKEQIAAQEGDLRTELLDQLIVLANSITAADELIAGHLFTTNAFSLVEETTHRDVRFTSFTFAQQTNTLDLFGSARSYRAVADQTRVLEAHPRVQSVQFGGLSQSDLGVVNFRLSITFQPSLIHQQPTN